MDIVKLLKVKYITYNSLEIVFFFPEKQNYEIKRNWISNDNCELLSFARFCCNLIGFFCVKLSSGATCGFFEGLTRIELRHHARSSHQHETSAFEKNTLTWSQFWIAHTGIQFKYNLMILIGKKHPKLKLNRSRKIWIWIFCWLIH